MSSFQRHDHSICSEHYKASIDEYCHENNLKLTPLRQKVLEILIRDHKPLGAYKILDILSKKDFSLSPPIAYRVLNFLIENAINEILGICSTCSSEGIA